jgi:hypothetical protein
MPGGPASCRTKGEPEALLGESPVLGFQKEAFVPCKEARTREIACPSQTLQQLGRGIPCGKIEPPDETSGFHAALLRGFAPFGSGSD